jgi:hypothetical protein
VVEGESSHPLRLAKHFRGASVELAFSGLKENRQMNDAERSAVLIHWHGNHRFDKVNSCPLSEELDSTMVWSCKLLILTVNAGYTVTRRMALTLALSPYFLFQLFPH